MGSYQSGQMGLTVTQLAYAFGGSNPSLPTRKRKVKNEKWKIFSFSFLTFHLNCGSSSVDRALAFQAEGRGFESRLPLFRLCSSEVEHFLGKEEVTGSIPVIGSE